MKQNLIEKKCDLYKLILSPGKSPNEISLCIKKSLSLITEIVGASLGYLEIRGPVGQLFYSVFPDNNDNLEEVRANISSSIIKESLNKREMIVTTNASFDDRFRAAQSVVRGKIESVLCTPIKSNDLTGVLYLQGNIAGLCQRNNIDEAELYKKSIRPLLNRLEYNISNITPEEDIRQKYNLLDVIGTSKEYLKILNEAMIMADLNVNLLINGDTGTGKTYLAKVVHNNSSRSTGPFIHINCANIPEKLLESDLFGSVPGAYSGITQRIEGKIKAADKGTLFLDEISEISLPSQAKLLQFLEEGFFYSLGSSQKHKPDVRVIFASNADFKKLISEGKFREDLYYRIATFPIIVPPLRKRKEDIIELSRFFLKEMTSKFKFDHFSLSDKAETCLKYYTWPGNLRELKNILQQGLIKAKLQGEKKIGPKHLFGHLGSKKDDSTISFSSAKQKWEKEFLQSQLEINNWNITRTAASLKMSRSHLNTLIREYQLERNI